MAGLVVAAVVFLVVVGAVVGGFVFASRVPGMQAQRRLERRLDEVTAAGGNVEDADALPSLIRSRGRGPLPRLDRVMGRTARGNALGRWLEQAGVRLSISGMLLLSLTCGGALALAGTFIAGMPWPPVGGAVLGMTIPFVILRRKRTSRLRKFEELFPEALDLMARAIRAGHGFTAGMKMVADEGGDPVGPEFRKTFDEQNFGLPLKDALANLTERVPLLDVRFFVTAVLIQRETGGNLSEILENLAHVVRERFKILRQVRVYTAHGRFTGYVLLGLPAALAIALMVINPEHMNLLFDDPLGHKLIAATLILQTVGYLWIRHVVKIEV